MTYGSRGAAHIVKNWSVDDYVQDGLIAMLYAPSQLSTDTKFTSLVGDLSLDIPTNAKFEGGRLMIDRNQGRKGTLISNTQFYTKLCNAVDAREMTLEVVYGLPEYGESAGTGLHNTIRATIGPAAAYGWLCLTSATQEFYTTNTSGSGFYWLSANVASTEGVHALSGSLAPSGVRAQAELWFDGVRKAADVKPSSHVADADVAFSQLKGNTWQIGPAYGVATVDEIYCFRVYSKALSEDQKRHNWRVDKALFPIS